MRGRVAALHTQRIVFWACNSRACRPALTSARCVRQADLGFFDYVYIEPARLRPNMIWAETMDDVPPAARADATAASLGLPTWVWAYGGDSDGEPDCVLPCKIGERLRIRVNKVLFSEPASRSSLSRAAGLTTGASAKLSAVATKAGALNATAVVAPDLPVSSGVQPSAAVVARALAKEKARAAEERAAPPPPTALQAAAARVGRNESEIAILGLLPPTLPAASVGAKFGASAVAAAPLPADAAAAAAAAARANDGAHLPPLPAAVRASVFAPKSSAPAPRLLRPAGGVAGPAGDEATSASASSSLAFMVNAMRNRAGGPVQRSYTSAQLLSLYGGDAGVNMAIFGSIIEDGLGPFAWWDRSEPLPPDDGSGVAIGGADIEMGGRGGGDEHIPGEASFALANAVSTAGLAVS